MPRDRALSGAFCGRTEEKYRTAEKPEMALVMKIKLRYNMTMLCMKSGTL